MKNTSAVHWFYAIFKQSWIFLDKFHVCWQKAIISFNLFTCNARFIAPWVVTIYLYCAFKQSSPSDENNRWTDLGTENCNSAGTAVCFVKRIRTHVRAAGLGSADLSQSGRIWPNLFHPPPISLRLSVCSWRVRRGPPRTPLLLITVTWVPTKCHSTAIIFQYIWYI